MTTFLDAPSLDDARLLRTCALDGCDVAVASPGHGGRPRLYCSDAHRAQARRRRLRTGLAVGEQGPVPAALGQLHQAIALLEGAAAASTERTAVDAEARARATAQLLDAQRIAADSAAQLVETRRQLVETRSQLVETRSQLERTRQSLQDLQREQAVERSRRDADRREADQRHQRDQATIAELQAALEGARAELEDELLRHHRDVAQLHAALGNVGAGGAG